MSWVWSNLDLVLALTLRHAALSVPPILLGFLLSVPLGYLCFRFGLGGPVFRVVSRTVLVVCALLYTIPSIPLFVTLPAVTGRSLLDPANVVIALTIYALALMVSVACDAFVSVDEDTRRAATAVGHDGWQRFLRVDLPLAGPVLLSGVRVVSVSTISLLTVGQLIGVTTLGYLFTNGFQRRITEEILTGIVAVVVIAVVFDVLLVLIGRLLMPWTRARRDRRAPAPLAQEQVAT